VTLSPAVLVVPDSWVPTNVKLFPGVSASFRVSMPMAPMSSSLAWVVWAVLALAGDVLLPVALAV
jgi:hypothetical protein